jgi:hypothetical protein
MSPLLLPQLNSVSGCFQSFLEQTANEDGGAGGGLHGVGGGQVVHAVQWGLTGSSAVGNSAPVQGKRGRVPAMV